MGITKRLPARLATTFACGLSAIFCAGCCCVGGADTIDDAQLFLPQPGEFPPVAALTATPATGVEPLDVVLDASASTDADGTIVSFDWDFEGDGTFDLVASQASINHTYESAGQFTPVVRVTDNDGRTDTATADVLVGAVEPPVAALTAAAQGIGSTIASFDASGSADPDGTIAMYEWDFDRDGTFDQTTTVPTVDHDYGVFGTFTAVVRVTDDDGLIDTAEAEVTLQDFDNVPPVALVAADPASGNSPLIVTWSAAGSTDTDGTIVTYDWDMDNDGTFELPDAGPTRQAMYPTGAVVIVGVRVTDDDGAIDTATGSIDINNPPVAAVSALPASGDAPLDVTWSAAASADSDGTIEQYDWDMDGDGIFELLDGGVTQQVSYPAALVATVVVRVTDNDGATDTESGTATVTTANVPPVAAVSGQPASGDVPLEVTWSAAASTDSDGTIVQYDWDMDNDGEFELENGGVTQVVTYEFGGGQITVGVRVTDDDGAIDSATGSVNPTTPNAPPVADLVPNPPAGDAPLQLNWSAAASTDSDGTIVSFDWDMDNDGTFEILDGGPTQDAVYLTGGIMTVVVRVTDNLGASDTATNTVDVNNPPVAGLVPDPAGGTASIDIRWDAATSSDSDGTIVNFDWDMDNDGTFEILNAASFQLATYAVGGIYTVGVRVTDNDGGMAATSESVDINNAPVPSLLPTPQSGPDPLDVVWSAAGSTDSDGTIESYDWDMDDNGTFEIIDGGTTQNATYLAVGIHVVRLRVTDNDGASATISANAEVTGIPPVADVTSNFEPSFAPAEIGYDASATFDPDGVIVRIDWDMDNDGIFEIIDGGDFQVAFYPDPGTYTVTVRAVDDDDLTDTEDDTITLDIPPP
jgi:PKD repeat protein